MADGEVKSIEEIQEGDWVMADHPGDSRTASPSRVTQAVKNWTESLTEIQTDRDGDGIADGSFRATPNHPMWTTARGWISAGSLRAGDALQDPWGSPVNVVAATSFNHRCATYNLNVAQQHSFFVLSGQTPVLAHNTSAGPRAWIVYRATTTINGVKHAYVGKASIPSNSKDFTPDKIFKSRYRRTGGDLVRKLPNGQIFKAKAEDVEFLHQFWDDGTPSNIYSSSGRIRTQGEVISQALEANEEFKYREDGRSLNKNRPLDPNRPDFDDILDWGDDYYRLLNGGVPCAGVIPH